MEMPDVIYAESEQREYFYEEGDSQIKCWNVEKYHHSRIVEVLRRENEELKKRCLDYAKLLDEQQRQNEELKAKLDKAKDGLYFYMDIGLYEGVSLGVAPINDDRGKRARTTLEEI